MNKELIEKVVQWILTSIKSDLPYEFHAKAIINLCVEHSLGSLRDAIDEAMV